MSSFFPGTYVALSHDGKTFYYSVNDNNAAKNNGLFTVHLIRRLTDAGLRSSTGAMHPS